jgi:molybdate transport system regulatory protein
LKAKTKLWFTEDGKTVIGAGRAELLKIIDEEHSLRKAASKLGTSYKQVIDETIGDETSWENIVFKFSARNRLPGKVIEAEKSGLVSKIKI